MLYKLAVALTIATSNAAILVEEPTTGYEPRPMWRPVVEPISDPEWEAFKQEYKKSYETPAEERERYQIFQATKQRVARLNAINKKAGDAFGITWMADRCAPTATSPIRHFPNAWLAQPSPAARPPHSPTSPSSFRVPLAARTRRSTRRATSARRAGRRPPRSRTTRRPAAPTRPRLSTGSTPRPSPPSRTRASAALGACCPPRAGSPPLRALVVP